MIMRAMVQLPLQTICGPFWYLEADPVRDMHYLIVGHDDAEGVVRGLEGLRENIDRTIANIKEAHGL